MLKYIKHFITITKHRYYVRKFCFKCGFYKRGLLHDLSKYSFTEFFSSAKYFQGTSSPIDAEKIEKGYSLAWQHHKGHNPHHWEYWIDNIGTYKNTPIKIPYEYVIEMICDWLGAGIVYSKQKVDFDKPYSEPIEYYNKCKSERIFHPETQALIEFYLDNIRVFGINNFCKRVKNGDYQKIQSAVEELRKKNEPQPDCAEPVERTEEMVNMKWVNYNYISKDKIKELREIDNIDLIQFKIKELLGE